MDKWLYLLVKTRVSFDQYRFVVHLIKTEGGMWFIVGHLISLEDEMTNSASSESNSEDAGFDYVK